MSDPSPFKAAMPDDLDQGGRESEPIPLDEPSPIEEEEPVVLPRPGPTHEEFPPEPDPTPIALDEGEGITPDKE